MKALNIPVGISNFEKIRNNGFYYVDKTGLIEELLKTEAEVTLITRPRRFGKTLGMSMLESFFDIRKNSRKLFEGLEIARQSELCSKWMNQCPTVSVSFRQVDGLNFTSAYDMLTMVFADLYNKHLYLLEDSHVTEFQKKTFTNIAHGCGSEKEVKSSLVLLTTMMQQHYGKAVVLLIDEYDVPVAKANAHGYYNEMLDVMKGLLQALKDNQALCFAVVTGCLKIAKESIFTGTNNFVRFTLSPFHTASNNKVRFHFLVLSSNHCITVVSNISLISSFGIISAIAPSGSTSSVCSFRAFVRYPVRYSILHRLSSEECK